MYSKLCMYTPQDNLVVETPRQRKQTRRYGSEHASNIFSLDNDEEPEVLDYISILSMLTIALWVV